MASVEDIKQELAKAEAEKQKAEAVLKEFNEGENQGKWLEELSTKLRKEEGTAAQRAEWKEEKTRLEERRKSLEKRRDDWDVEVQKWGAKLREMTSASQPGNDFVTRALGT